MPRWTRENAYDDLVIRESANNSVPVSLVKAIIAKESGFIPNARRAEAPRDSLPPTADFPKGGDESRGLMQLLLRTARGLGYAGTLDGLNDPATNLHFGVRLLRDNFRRVQAGVLSNAGIVKQWDAAIAAYNAGWSSQRKGDAPRTKNNVAAPFTNQSYVNAVRQFESYFKQNPPAGQEPDDAGGGGGLAPVWLLAIPALLLLLAGRRGGLGLTSGGRFGGDTPLAVPVASGLARDQLCIQRMCGPFHRGAVGVGVGAATPPNPTRRLRRRAPHVWQYNHGGHPRRVAVLRGQGARRGGRVGRSHRRRRPGGA